MQQNQEVGYAVINYESDLIEKDKINVLWMQHFVNQEEAKTVTLLPPAPESAQGHKGLAPAPKLAAAQGRLMPAR